MPKWLRLTLAIGTAGLALAALALGLALARPARAAPTDTVITNCTEAGLDAALDSGGDITFNCGPSAHIGITHVYTVTQDTHLDGSGATIVIDGGGARRIFGVNSGVHFQLANLTLQSGFSFGSDGGAIANHGNLALDGVLIQNSDTDDSHSGGAIFSDGPLTITSSAFISNTGGSAGAIFANFGNAIVHISNSTFSGNQTVNTVTGFGGAIWVGENAQVFISGGVFTSNIASGAGGGIYNSLGRMTLTNVWMQANRATSDSVDTFGGAIDDYQGDVSVSGSSFISNSARYGGGIFVTQGSLALTDTQFIRNVAITTGGGLYDAESPVTATATTFDTNYANGGGAVFNDHGDLVASGSNFLNNLAHGAGGGIDNDLGSVTLTNDTFSGNQARLAAPLATVAARSATESPDGPAVASNGGGIANFEGGLMVSATTFYSNSAPDGGGLANFGGNATLANVTFSRNTATVGGGILHLSGALVVTATTWFSNSASIYGGGVYVNAGAATLGNDTFNANAAEQGSGLYDNIGPVALTNVTLSGNPAQPGGGTLHAASQRLTSTISLSNTLLAAGGVGGNCSGTLMVSHGYDLSDDGTCATFFNWTGDLNNANPHLGPLANNGGPTLTLLPGAGSPAIDAIPNGTDGCGLFLTTDQRGAPRPIHGQCDIGAVEAGAVLPQLWLPLAQR